MKDTLQAELKAAIKSDVNRNPRADCYCAAALLHLSPDNKDAKNFLTSHKATILKMASRPYEEESRYFASVVLGELSVKEARNLLQSMSNDDPSARVRRAARRSLLQLEK